MGGLERAAADEHARSPRRESAVHMGVSASGRARGRLGDKSDSLRDFRRKKERLDGVWLAFETAASWELVNSSAKLSESLFRRVCVPCQPASRLACTAPA